MIGFRALTWQHGTFRSPQQGTPWPDGKLVATCENGCPEVPSFGKWEGPKMCWCGIHVSYFYESAMSYVGRYSPIHFPVLVEGFGRCIDHELGFRAEEADIIGLIKAPPLRSICLTLENYTAQEKKMETDIQENFIIGSLLGQKQMLQELLVWASPPQKQVLRSRLRWIHREINILRSDYEQKEQYIYEAYSIRNKLIDKISKKFNLPVYEEIDAIRLMRDWLEAEGRLKDIMLAISKSDQLKQEAYCTIHGLEGIDWNKRYEELSKMERISHNVIPQEEL